jgi:hypothetical protein
MWICLLERLNASLSDLQLLKPVSSNSDSESDSDSDSELDEFGRLVVLHHNYLSPTGPSSVRVRFELRDGVSLGGPHGHLRLLKLTASGKLRLGGA